jgi:hypothetical protein
MDCDNNHNIDASRPRPAHGEKGRINHTVVTWSMRHRSDTTCLHGMERRLAKMSIALGGGFEHKWGSEGGDTTPRFLQTLHYGLAAW